MLIMPPPLEESYDCMYVANCCLIKNTKKCNTSSKFLSLLNLKTSFIDFKTVVLLVMMLHRCFKIQWNAGRNIFYNRQNVRVGGRQRSLLDELTMGYYDIFKIIYYITVI